MCHRDCAHVWFLQAEMSINVTAAFRGQTHVELKWMYELCVRTEVELSLNPHRHTTEQLQMQEVEDVHHHGGRRKCVVFS